MPVGVGCGWLAQKSPSHSGIGSRMIARAFFAFGFLSQRPIRCSCPVQTARNLPSEATARPLTKPSAGTAPTGLRLFLGPATLASQRRTTPSEEPEATKSRARAEPRDTTHGRTTRGPSRGAGGFPLAEGGGGGSSLVAAPGPAAMSVCVGFFLRWDQIEMSPASSPVTKVSSPSMRTHSTEVDPLFPRKTSCLSSAHFHCRAVRSRPPVIHTSLRSTSSPFTAHWWP
mmetsp:Transcript_14420/g.34106  ORF Transcript_14420/g.34106 Transcript_14420/m.34106 type:complete len:228 (+) Transcript_14420:42-725(+)